MLVILVFVNIFGIVFFLVLCSMEGNVIKYIKTSPKIEYTHNDTFIYTERGIEGERSREDPHGMKSVVLILLGKNAG